MQAVLTKSEVAKKPSYACGALGRLSRSKPKESESGGDDSNGIDDQLKSTLGSTSVL
jgi:hypothetical protein